MRPEGRFALSGYRDIADVDPFSSGRTLGNTLNALFVAHDDADYLLAEGGAATFETSLRSGLDLILGARVERETSVGREAESAVNDVLGGDGVFPPNPPVDEGTFGGGSVRLAHTGGIRWNLTADVLGGAGHATGRLFGDIRADVGEAVRRHAPAQGGHRDEPDAAAIPLPVGRPGHRARIRLRHGHRTGLLGRAARSRADPRAAFGPWRSWMPVRRRAPTISSPAPCSRGPAWAFPSLAARFDWT